MLYITGVNKGNIIQYNLFETHTESIIVCEVKHISKLVKRHGMILKNATIDNGELKLNEWPHPMVQSTIGFWEHYNNMLLAKTNNSRFKVLNTNATIKYLDEEDLKSRIIDGRISNCKDFEDSNGITFKSTDTYETINKDENFEKYIAKKYKDYIAKTKLLGINSDFDYTIEGKEVKLQKYKGSSKKIIIPNFITTITGEAFYSLEIAEVNLNEGLQHIGSSAFACNNIKYIEIPKTVQFIGRDAFNGNAALLKTKIINNSMKPKIMGYNEATFRLESNKTIVIDKILGNLRR